MTTLDINTLTENYYAALPNKTRKRPKCVILFSGVPGSGKSYIAERIENNLGAIRISNDTMRDWIVAANPAINPTEREEIKLHMATKLLRCLESAANGLIVFDVSCDRPGGYAFYADWARGNGYEVLLLRMDVPRKLIEQRIRTRGDEGYRTVSRSLELLDTWWSQWEDFGKQLTPDITITPSTNIDEVIEKVKHAAKLAD